MYRFVRSSFRFTGPLAAVLFSVGLVTAGAQAPAGGQAPAVPGAAPAAGAQAPGGPGGPGGGRGGGRGRPPSELRSIPAETTIAKVKDPKWQAPRTPWGHPDIQGDFSTDDMNSVPMSRPKAQMDRQSLTSEEFLARASGDEAQKYSAVNVDTFLRNERGTRTFGYTSFVIDPPNGQLPPMVEAYRTARAGKWDRGTFGTGPFDNFNDFTLYERCITRGILGSTLPVIYGNGIRIVQSPTAVAISYEMIHDTRIIMLDNRTLPGSAIKQYVGASRGHWEGETLVVETSNLTDLTSIGSNGNGSRHSDKMKLTEWFTRVDPQMIEYKVRVEDPVAYTAPFTLRLMFTSQPEYAELGGVLEYSCHEGNGAVGFALSADRAYDRKVAEAKAKGLPIPPREMLNAYGAPPPGTEVLDVNTGQKTVTPGRAGGGPGGPGGGGRGGPGGGAPQP
jgi:hypothetical protein